MVGRPAAASTDACQLVGLETQPPLRMRQAIADRCRGVRRPLRIVHRLQEEAGEGEAGVTLRLGAGLRVDQLEFIAVRLDEIRAGLRADAYPVDALRRGERAVGLDPDLEAACVQRGDGRVVQLQ